MVCKRLNQKVDIFHFAMCDSKYRFHKNVAYRWNKVTCKKCLAKRKRVFLMCECPCHKPEYNFRQEIQNKCNCKGVS